MGSNPGEPAFGWKLMWIGMDPRRNITRRYEFIPSPQNEWTGCVGLGEHARAEPGTGKAITDTGAGRGNAMTSIGQAIDAL